MLSDFNQEELIQIRASAKRNGLTSLILGGLGLLLAASLLTWLPTTWFLIGILALSAALVTLLIGLVKLAEPAHSVELSRQTVFYRQRHGNWQVNWDNIQRIDVPRLSSGLEQQKLGLVGIKIKDYRPVLDKISPRLISNMLTEQRPLLLQSQACNSGACYSEAMFENDRFKFADGSEVTGLKAMLANRMSRLRELLGYDLFISAAELDRDTESFVSLLRQCQRQVLQQHEC